MTPAELLASAESILSSASAGTQGNSARLAALVARQALEALIDQRCAELGVECDRATMRSRLAILKSLDAQDRADRFVMLWQQLSMCCHQHAYELSPTVDEVRSLCARVAESLT